MLPSVSWASSVSTNFLFLSFRGLLWDDSSTWDLCCWERKKMKKTSEHQQKMPLPSQWTMQMVSKYAINVQWSMVATGGAIHNTQPWVESGDDWSWCVTTYTGWDHKWDLLVIESVHVIWVIGGLQYRGGGEMFALKRQRLGHFVGHWKTKLMVQTWSRGTQVSNEYIRNQKLFPFRKSKSLSVIIRENTITVRPQY